MNDEERHARLKQIPMPNFYDGCTLDDYWVAPSGLGPLAAEWADKPHRLLYELINYIEKMYAEPDLEELLKHPAFAIGFLIAEIKAGLNVACENEDGWDGYGSGYRQALRSALIITEEKYQHVLNTYFKDENENQD